MFLPSLIRTRRPATGGSPSGDSGLTAPDGFPNLVADRNRCLGRAAYRKAVADQCADFAKHTAADMKYELRRDD